VIFQTDLQPRATRRFRLTTGDRRIAKKDEYRAYGRFVRERRDDFAWENDLVAQGSTTCSLHSIRMAGGHSSTHCAAITRGTSPSTTMR
jgi:hypothetical protein